MEEAARQDAAGACTSTKPLDPSEGFGLRLFSGLDFNRLGRIVPTESIGLEIGLQTE